MILALAGFMGCGKSSIGRELSRLLGCDFADLDDVIVQNTGSDIPEIFAVCGESGFRAMELGALETILTSDGRPANMVLSLGGGTLMTQECADLVRSLSTCIYLRASVDTLEGNLLLVGTENRPMLSGKKPLRERIEELMQMRSAIYESTAHYIIDTDGKDDRAIATEIIKTLGL